MDTLVKGFKETQICDINREGYLPEDLGHLDRLGPLLLSKVFVFFLLVL